MRTKRVDINFIKEGTDRKDIELFFAPFEDDEFIFFDNNSTMAHIMSFAGIFPSVSQARKNGWNKPIPEGFSEFIVGKSKAKITILNKMP